MYSQFLTRFKLGGFVELGSLPTPRPASSAYRSRSLRTTLLLPSTSAS